MKIFHLHDAKCERYLTRLDNRPGQLLGDQVFARARAIVADIRRRGDQALLKHIKGYDLDGLSRREIRLGSVENMGEEDVAEDLQWAIDACIDALQRFHRQQQRNGYEIDHDSTRTGLRVHPVASVGVVLPSRQAVDLTSLIMTVVPARMAGVPRVAIAVSPRVFLGHGALRYLLHRLEIDEVYLMGGVHAIAALAYGTDSVAPVDLILARGGSLIAAAKQLVARRVAVDLRGCCTELAVIVDEDSDPTMAACDLLAHLEQGEENLGVVIATSPRAAQKVNTAVRSRLRRLQRGHPVRDVLRRWCAIVVVETAAEAAALVNRLGLSRVELLAADPDDLVERITSVASVAVGPWSAPAVVDSASGLNYMLPGLGSSRLRGPLTVWDFSRVSSTVRIGAEHYPKMARAAHVLAEVQGLTLRAESLSVGSRGEG